MEWNVQINKKIKKQKAERLFEYCDKGPYYVCIESMIDNDSVRNAITSDEIRIDA